MNFQKFLHLFLALVVGTGFSLDGMNSEVKPEPTIKMEKLYDDQLADEIFKFLHGGDVNSLATINSARIEQLFSLNGENSLLNFIEKNIKSYDKQVIFFSVCRALNRFLLATSSRIRKIFLRLATHGIDITTSEDPLSAFFNELQKRNDFKDCFEKVVFKNYCAQWSQQLIKGRVTYSMPKNNKPEQKAHDNEHQKQDKELIDVEGVFEGDQKKLINVGGSIDIELKKGSLMLSCGAGSQITLKKIDSATTITIEDQDFLERLNVVAKQSKVPQESYASPIFEEIDEEVPHEIKEKTQQISLKQVIGDNLSLVAPLSILSVAAGAYCLVDMPGISALALAGVFYITHTYKAGIKRFYDEVTRSEDNNTNQETKK